MSTQNITSNNSNSQINIANNKGAIVVNKKSRLSSRFERLQDEINNNILYDEIIDDLFYYNTKIDGKSMPEKLKDGNFSEGEIIRASYLKQRYWKKSEKYKFYESAQLIDLEIFAIIMLEFNTHVNPLIENTVSKHEIKKALNKYVVKPILTLLNEEGGDDKFLNYTADDILGMIYFLTGKCHINWINYDDL